MLILSLIDTRKPFESQSYQPNHLTGSVTVLAICTVYLLYSNTMFWFSRLHECMVFNLNLLN